MSEAYLYFHGKGGNAAEAQHYKTVLNREVIGIEYYDTKPWLIRAAFQKAYTDARAKHTEIGIIANSIGAYLSMDTLQGCEIKQAILISPVLNMEELICKLMKDAGVSEQELQVKKEIKTDLGETIHWEYLLYTRNNPIIWDIPTEILYAQNDEITPQKTLDDFIKGHKNANVTIVKDAVHWFHTVEQIAIMDAWLKRVAQ